MESFLYSLEEALTNLFAGMSVVGAILLGLAAILFCLGLVFFFRIWIAYKMAKNRHRDPLAWALLSFFVSPVLTWIILLIVGDANHQS